MKLTNIVFCLTLLVGVATSCVREDLDDCLSTNKLLLSYKGDGTTEIFPDKICRVEMFVFDAENRCVNSSILPEEQVKDRTATVSYTHLDVYKRQAVKRAFAICLVKITVQKINSRKPGLFLNGIFLKKRQTGDGMI